MALSVDGKEEGRHNGDDSVRTKVGRSRGANVSGELGPFVPLCRPVVSQSSGLITQDRQRQSVLEPGLRASYFRLSLLKLRLTEFNDRTQSKFVACLGEVESQIRLGEQLLVDTDAIEGCAGGQPARAYVA